MSESNGNESIIKKLRLKNGRTVVLRFLKQPDVHGIWENFNEVVADKVYLPVYTPVTSEWEKDEWYRDLLAKKNTCLVADDISRPVGRQIVGQLTLENIEWEAAEHVCQLGIIIQKDYRNLGLGFQLISAAKQVAKSKKKKKIMLTTLSTNLQGIFLYEKCGFKQVGRCFQQYLVNNQYVDEIIMETFLE